MDNFKAASNMNIAVSQADAASKSRLTGQLSPAVTASPAAGQPAKISPQELSEIKTVATKFESLFLDMLFNSMSKEVGKGSFIDNGPGYKIFSSLFYESIANSETYGNGIGIARMIVGYFKEHPSLVQGLGEEGVSSSLDKLSGTNNIFQAYKLLSKSDIGYSPASISEKEGAQGASPPSQDGNGNGGNYKTYGGDGNSSYGNNQSYSDGNVTPDELAKKASEIYGIPCNLIKAVIKTESDFNPYAVSDKGAIGLMQLTPGTARDLGVDPYNPFYNVLGGTSYLKKLLGKYGGNIKLALAAYNAGPENVDKYGGVPPFEETRNYVKNVLNYYEEYNNAPDS